MNTKDLGCVAVDAQTIKAITPANNSADRAETNTTSAIEITTTTTAATESICSHLNTTSAASTAAATGGTADCDTVTAINSVAADSSTNAEVNADSHAGSDDAAGSNAQADLTTPCSIAVDSNSATDSYTAVAGDSAAGTGSHKFVETQDGLAECVLRVHAHAFRQSRSGGDLLAESVCGENSVPPQHTWAIAPSVHASPMSLVEDDTSTPGSAGTADPAFDADAVFFVTIPGSVDSDIATDSNTAAAAGDSATAADSDTATVTGSDAAADPDAAAESKGASDAATANVHIDTAAAFKFNNTADVCCSDSIWVLDLRSS
jgi:hypothetical protein